MKTGRPEYYIPSPFTVSRDVKLVFANVRKRIARLLQDYDGDLNFTTDAWTSPNHRAFIAVSVHLEHEGQPLAMLLDIVEVAKSHSGMNLAEAFAKILDDFGISDKARFRQQHLARLTDFHQMLSITADNASSNDTMTTELAKLIDHFGGEAACTRCFLHIINLVAKSLIKEFDVPKHHSVESLDSADHDLQDLAGDIDIEDKDTIAENGDGDPNADDADDAEGWIDEINELDDFDCDALQENIRPIKLVLVKVSQKDSTHPLYY